LADTAFDDNDHTGCGVKDIFEVMNQKAKEDKEKGIQRRPSESNVEMKGDIEGNANGNKVEQTPAINDEKVQS